MVRLIPKRWKKQLRNFRVLAQEYGQYRTMTPDGIVDRNGEPIPWITYPALEYLNAFDFHDKTVFEFGAGNSSSYWAKRAKQVTSVESEADWYPVVLARKQDNQTLVFADSEEDYVSCLARQGRSFDVVIVDGLWRRRCAEEAARHVAADGLIILDNSEWYLDATWLLREAGFFQIDFSGFGPRVAHTWTTSLFVKLPNGLQANFGDPVPVGGRPYTPKPHEA